MTKFFTNHLIFPKIFKEFLNKPPFQDSLPESQPTFLSAGKIANSDGFKRGLTHLI